jgi:TM2 domain-containing membrane protein YozV
VSQEWYYSVDGDRQGPVTAADLKKLADAGTLKATDLVWKDGMADWAQAKTVKGLFGGGSAANPAPARAEEPVRERRRDEDDNDRPSSRGRRREDDDDDDRPRRRRDEDDEDDDRPSGRVRRRDDDDDEDDDLPARRRDDDDEDEDRPRKKKKRGRVPEDIPNKKLVAGLLGILLGGFGVHKFYLGFTTAGVIMILLCCTGVSGIIGLIEGIIYLTKSDQDFYREYVVDEKQWF